MKVFNCLSILIAIFSLSMLSDKIISMEVDPNGRIQESSGLTAWKTMREFDNISHTDSSDYQPDESTNPGLHYMESSDEFVVTLDPSNKHLVGTYDASTQTAQIAFNNVITTKQSTTPPNIANPKLVMIGYVYNPSGSQSDSISLGSESSTTTLWGIPTTSSNTQSSSNEVLQPLVNTIKKYTPKTRTAILNDGSIFVGVVEYSQAVTPPNVTTPALQQFGSIKNPRYNNSGKIAGGQGKYMSLWGIKVTGPKLAVRDLLKNKTIGYFWSESKIAQLNTGETIVGTKTQHQGNYTKGSAHATGPIWTQYSTDELAMLQKDYNVTPTATNTPAKGIGIVTIDRQKRILFGVSLQAPQSPIMTTKPLAISARSSTTHSQSPLQHIHKETETPGMDQFQNHVSMTSSQAAALLYGAHIGR